MKQKIKTFIKILLPKKLLQLLKDKMFLHVLKKSFVYDYNRYSKYCDRNESTEKTHVIAKIIREYHVIEKGLTMPERRLGYGKDMIISLSKSCLFYIENYDIEEPQIKHALGVLFEYQKIHELEKYPLNEDILKAINAIKSKSNNQIQSTNQYKYTNQEYFSSINNDFLNFSNSRKSVRNFTAEPISNDQINSALELACNTPSACNRQSWRTYVYTDKTQIKNILEIQGGNRGFGHLADKLIVICGEVGMFCGEIERNEVFIDGGMYAMNLLYALHYNRIGACILNCSTTIEKDLLLREHIALKPSEVFIAMIVCGNVPEVFSVPISKRYEINKTNRII